MASGIDGRGPGIVPQLALVLASIGTAGLSVLYVRRWDARPRDVEGAVALLAALGGLAFSVTSAVFGVCVTPGRIQVREAFPLASIALAFACVAGRAAGPLEASAIAYLVAALAAHGIGAVRARRRGVPADPLEEEGKRLVEP